MYQMCSVVPKTYKIKKINSGDTAQKEIKTKFSSLELENIILSKIKV